MKSRISSDGLTVIAAVLIMLSVIGLAAAVQTSLRLSSYMDCRARYDDQLNRRTRIVTEAAEAERKSERNAKDALVRVFRHPQAFTPRDKRTPQQQIEIDILVRAWGAAEIQEQEERQQADRLRSENPVPPPPSEVCGR